MGTMIIEKPALGVHRELMNYFFSILKNYPSMSLALSYRRQLAHAHSNLRM